MHLSEILFLCSLRAFVFVTCLRDLLTGNVQCGYLPCISSNLAAQKQIEILINHQEDAIYIGKMLLDLNAGGTPS